MRFLWHLPRCHRSHRTGLHPPGGGRFGNRGFDIEIVFADNQNRPDIGSNVTRQWFDREGVDAVVDGGASSVALAVNDITREKNKVFLNSSSATSDLTGTKCTPNTVHWTYDTWMLAKSTGGATVRAGGDIWYFVTADYAFGHALERKRPFEARLPAMWVNVLGQSGAAGFRMTLWIALRTTPRVSVIGGSRF
ncbi:ABC transporter substrate-binding protein [Siccirubricoccus sp. G192]|uniref:ABC transporter substrate-binding protein n=1 Tax=Siccirubricoccus sp. G192 TaxID=2849651 RepID=UPI0020C53D0C|nr:ABC transporter substrate-binding protein [Siccirubricoccus sp. G192]